MTRAYSYTVTTYTAKVSDSGTDDAVYIEIQGLDDKGKIVSSGKKRLDSSGNDFEGGSIGIYPIVVNDVAEPTSIRLSKTGSDGWTPVGVSIASGDKEFGNYTNDNLYMIDSNLNNPLLLHRTPSNRAWNETLVQPTKLTSINDNPSATDEVVVFMVSLPRENTEFFRSIEVVARYEPVYQDTAFKGSPVHQVIETTEGNEITTEETTKVSVGLGVSNGFVAVTAELSKETKHAILTTQTTKVESTFGMTTDDKAVRVVWWQKVYTYTVKSFTFEKDLSTSFDVRAPGYAKTIFREA